MTEVVEGQVLAGKYRVERVLGVGGMGMVVAAMHLQLDERVAIKFMLPEALANAEAVARFAREARAAVKIKSEHVARVWDVGVLETGAPYMVMEYLEGSDLAGWLKQHGRLSVEQAVEFVLQAGEAIAEAHSLGIVHRDLKPANLFVVRRPSGGLSVKVLDFGISKMTRNGLAEAGVTKSSATMGSPLYMSPELISEARDANARCDIWALGVILYELLSGVTPFMADNLFNVLLQIAQSTPAPVRTHAPHVPPGLDLAISKCLEKDPGRRYANVAQLAAALIDFAPTRARVSLERISGVLGPDDPVTTQLESVGLPLVAASNAVSNPTSASWGQTSPSRAPNRRALIGIAAFSAAALVVAASFVALQSRRSAAQAAHSGEPLLNAGSSATASLTSAPASAAVSLTRVIPTSEPPLAISAALSASPPLLSASAATSAAKPPPILQKSKEATHKPPGAPHPAPVTTGGVYDDRK